MKRIITRISLIGTLFISAPTFGAQTRIQVLTYVKGGLVAAGAMGLGSWFWNIEEFSTEIQAYTERRDAITSGKRKIVELEHLKELLPQCQSVEDFNQRGNLSEVGKTFAIAANWVGWTATKLGNWFWQGNVQDLDSTWECAQRTIRAGLDAQIAALNIAITELKNVPVSNKLKLAAAGLVAGFVGLCMHGYQTAKNPVRY